MKSGVHFGGQGAGLRSKRGIGGPDPLLGVALREVFEDGERLPDDDAIRGESGHPTCRRVALDIGARRREIERDDHFLESDLKMAHEQPGPQRPG